MDVKDRICRLCLKAEGDFILLDEYRTTKLNMIIPKLNINESGNFMICTKCKESLDQSYTLKKTISDNEGLIRARKNKLQIYDKVSLDQIFNDSGSSDTSTICRICLNSKDSGNVDLDTVPADASFYDVLQTCLSDMNRDLTSDPIICESCISKVCDMYSFFTASLAVEEKIKEYRESDPEIKDMDTNKVLSCILKGESAKICDETKDFLSEFEVQDEEGTDIFDSIPSLPSDSIDQPASKENSRWESDYDNTNRKRATEVPNEAEAPKKPRTTMPITADNMTSDDLPSFKFNFQLVYNTKMGFTVGDFMSIVDTHKKKYNWSDNMAIQKVLLRMQSISGLHTWFSSIGDILTWDEWKNKVIQAFPTEDDYCISLKRALNRKKKPNETYVEYFKDKVALLENKNITGVDAISCIVQGLSWQDVLVYCLARIGNYKTTAELLEYFKKSDEKYAVSDTNDKPEPEREKVVSKTTDQVTKPSTPDSSSPQSKTVVDWKQMKGRCFKCMNSGHMAADCTHSHPANVLKPIPKLQIPSNDHPRPSSQVKTSPGQSGAKKKNKVKAARCTYCGKFGHKTGVCPHAKLSELRRVQFENQSRPNKNQPPKCAHCGQTNHKSFNCPRPNRDDRAPQAKKKNTYPTKAGARAPPRPAPAQNQKKDKCLYCNKVGHKTAQCRIGKRQVRRESAVQKCTTCGELGHSHCQRPQTGMSQQQYGLTMAERYVAAGRGSPNNRSNCQYCGSASHMSSACYYASNTEENYMTNSGGQSYQQLLCFKCYKIGHRSEDCSRVEKWSNRK